MAIIQGKKTLLRKNLQKALNKYFRRKNNILLTTVEPGGEVFKGEQSKKDDETAKKIKTKCGDNLVVL